ncbi:MAG: hypothetical protein ACI4L8_07110, partial [Candidatus Fimadaptatus sp.]
LDDVSTFYEGVIDYTEGVGALAEGAGDLVDGAAELAGSYGSEDEEDSGLGLLLSGAEELSHGAGELADGTALMRERTADISGSIDGEIDSIISDLTGAELPTVSFASEKNGEIASLQFVIRTASISAPEQPAS